jgi:hypothetical protein
VRGVGAVARGRLYKAALARPKGRDYDDEAGETTPSHAASFLIKGTLKHSRPGCEERSRFLTMQRRLAASLFILIMGVALCARASNTVKPLSADDLTLLLIGGTSSQKIVSLIEQRGIDFKLTPVLAKQFYEDGATDEIMDALQRASRKVNANAAPPSAQTTNPTAAPSQSHSGPMSPSLAAGAGSGRGIAASSISAPSPSPGAASPVVTRARTQSKPALPPPPSNTPLPDPNAAEVQHIIQTFAAKELLFKEARNNYTYHQTNRVYTLDASGSVNGSWEQDWDILFDGSGNRIEKVTYAPPSNLGDGLIVTQQDINAFQSIQPFVLTTDELPEYNIRYLGHVHVDYLTCYVFSVRPNEIKKNHQYFDGIVYVDDHDLQIVKAEGRNVPQTKDNRFPRFTTWRQQIDGKYWFPVFTQAKDTLYFENGAAPAPIIEIVKYTDYKQFRSRTRIISYSPVNQPGASAGTKH